jgi:SAM-dependent methyltransferase
MKRMTAMAALRRVRTRLLFGDLGRTHPVSSWGTRRGKPVDRWYIERYLDSGAHAVHGAALEVKNDMYASRYGAASVEIVDIDPHNPRATIVGDLCAAGTLPAAHFDVAVVTQTLQSVDDPAAAVRSLIASLRPGGCLLVTVPCLSRLIDEADRWRWTPSGLLQLLRSAAPAGADVRVEGLGNGLAGRAFLFGLAAEDLDDDVLSRTDPHYPLIAGGSVCLPS